MVAMAYLYFSRLNVQSSVDYTSLYAASTNSALVFSLENDKNIHNILNDQVLFKNLLGEDKFSQLKLLKQHLIDQPAINAYIDKQNLYFSFLPGKNNDINFLIATQLVDKRQATALIGTLRTAGISVDSADQLLKIKLKDESEYYLGIEKQLLLISDAAEPVMKAVAGLKDRSNHDFVEYIRANKRMSTNTLACLHINFNHFPALLKNITPNKLINELAVFNNQDAFATLTYNFSKEKLLFNGSTFISDSKSYYNLFTKSAPIPININEILPQHSANYVIYAMDNYSEWKKGLDEWFKSNKENKKIDQLIETVAAKYRLNLHNVFPLYFKNQLITFQLSNGDRLGAINVRSDIKINQLLLDVSDDYSPGIRIFKEPGILYAFFGKPVENFKKPYYTLIDNHLIFSNSSTALRSFINNYQQDSQLINTPAYANMSAQLPGSANICFYVNNENSERLFRGDIYLPFYRHIRDEQGLKNFNSMIYQLTADKDKFQTNLLLNLQLDSLSTNP
jgi:hypothetical protein